jgi:hypothetical protein
MRPALRCTSVLRAATIGVCGIHTFARKPTPAPSNLFLSAANANVIPDVTPNHTSGLIKTQLGNIAACPWKTAACGDFF